MSNVVKDWLPFPTRSCSLVLATPFPIRYKLLVLSHPVSTCSFGRLSQNLTPCTMFCKNGIYRDVTLPVDGWCAMTCQHVHNHGEYMPLLHARIVVWSDGTDVLVIWYHTTAVRTCSPSLCTCWQAITRQRSTGNVTFLHPFHCCRTWCQVLWKSHNTTCTYRMWQYKQFIPNRKMCRQN
jgi:hypothetical protein